MAANAFQPYATGLGANVMSPAAFAAATARTQGVSAGQASSAFHNASIRQAGFPGSALAQLMADYGPRDVSDDGVIANFETSLHQTLNRAFNRWTWIGQFGGTSNALTATLTPAPDSIAPGHKVRGVVGAANTGPATLTVLGTAYPITLSEGKALIGGEFTVGQELELTAYGLLGSVTSFVMTSPLPISYFGTHYQQIIPATTFYIRSDGSDATGDGSAAKPWLTLPGAFQTIASRYSSSGITLNVGPGTFAPCGFSASFIGNWTIVGAGVNSTFISAPTTATNNGWGLGFSNTTAVISALTLTAVYAGMQAQTATVTINNCNFVGIGAQSQGIAADYGSLVVLTGTSIVSGSFLACFSAGNSGVVYLGTYNGVTHYPFSCTFSGVTVVQGTVFSHNGATFTIDVGYCTLGATGVTGPRYSIVSFATIATGGGGANFFPGTTAGTISVTGTTPTGVYS